MTETIRRWCYENPRLLAISGLFASLLIPPATYMAWATYVMTAPAISHASMERLQVGMTAAETRALLGDPTSIGHSPHEQARWTYCPGTWAIYVIEFDASGRITKHWHDY